MNNSKKKFELIVRAVQKATYFVFLWILGNLVWHYLGNDIIRFLECIFKG